MIDVEKQLAKVDKLFQMISEEYVTPEEVIKLSEVLFGALNFLQQSLEQKMLENKDGMDTKLQMTDSNLASIEARLTDNLKELDDKLAGDISDVRTLIAQKVKEVMALIPTMPSLQPLEQKISEVEAKIPNFPEEITPTQVRDKLETLKEEERLDISAIRGFEKTIEDLKASDKPIRIGGGSRGFQLYVGSTKKGLAQFVNLVAGSNVTISDSITNGLHTITFASTGGGGGFTKLTATETPNGSITAFTFSAASAQPSFIVADNVWLQAVTANSVTNWTWNGGTKKATLSIPVTSDIWGVV